MAQPITKIVRIIGRYVDDIQIYDYDQLINYINDNGYTPFYNSGDGFYESYQVPHASNERGTVYLFSPQTLLDIRFVVNP